MRSLTPEYDRSMSLPKYVSVSMAELTDSPCGYDRSSITHLSEESFFSLVLRGESMMGLMKGDL